MYAGGTYLSKYCCEYIKREKKIKIGKWIITAVIAICLIGIMVTLPNKLESATDSTGMDNAATAEVMAVMPDVLLQEGMPGLTAFAAATSEITSDINTLAAKAKTLVIFVDAGHGGEDGGCERKGVLEKTINLEIAKLVQSKLQTLGYEVIMAREDDTYLSKEDRVWLANKSKADLYISIHQNSSDDTSVSGMEVWYDETDTTRDNKRLAQLIRQQTVNSTQAVERELRGNADFYVTEFTSMPACLVETGFLSNAKERGKLVTEEYQEQIAAGIVQGIDDYFHPNAIP